MQKLKQEIYIKEILKEIIKETYIKEKMLRYGKKDSNKGII